MGRYSNKKRVMGRGRGKYGVVTTVYGGKNYKNRIGTSVINKTFRTKANAETAMKKVIKAHKKHPVLKKKYKNSHIVKLK